MKLNYLYLIFVKNWKTTFAGILLGVFTFMYYLGKIDTSNYAIAIGLISTIIGIFAKDADKKGVINPADHRTGRDLDSHPENLN